MSDLVKEQLKSWQSWLEDNSAQDIAIEEMKDVSDLCDYSILATVKNSRHMAHLSEEAMTHAKDMDVSLIHADGLDNREWVVLDFGIYLIHFFLPETREKYKLEHLWSELRNEDKKEKYL